jgi:hypothetical protein
LISSRDTSPTANADPHGQHRVACVHVEPGLETCRLRWTSHMANRLEQYISETPEQRGTLKKYNILEASSPTIIHVGDGYSLRYKTPDGTEGDVGLRHVERVSERKFHKRAPVFRTKVSAEVRCTDLGRTLHCIPDSPVVCISVEDRCRLPARIFHDTESRLSMATDTPQRDQRNFRHGRSRNKKVL